MRHVIIGKYPVCVGQQELEPLSSNWLPRLDPCNKLSSTLIVIENHGSARSVDQISGYFADAENC